MKVEWLTAAEEDLREIARRVADDFGYDTAERTVASVVAETERLADFPRIGRRCDEYPPSRHEYRALYTSHDRIVYTIGKDCVLIVAVFDTRRSPDSLKNILRDREAADLVKRMQEDLEYFRKHAMSNPNANKKKKDSSDTDPQPDAEPSEA